MNEKRKTMNEMNTEQQQQPKRSQNNSNNNKKREKKIDSFALYFSFF